MEKNTPRLSIAHISDLHFSMGADATAQHSHSIELLSAAETSIRKLAPDYLFLTGDISNRGDRESLLRAHDWLFGQFTVGGGKTTGLGYSPERVGLVPGNHDAWNARTSNPIWSHEFSAHRQSSLKNFNFAFSSSHGMPTPHGCHYRWIEHEGIELFVAFVDSSLLGEKERIPNLPNPLARVARGRLSTEQTEQLLDWHDAAMAGCLAVQQGGQQCINPESFRHSLKILVMHHYLFEPPGHNREVLLSIDDRARVFVNLALAEFDLLMCGHKHVAASLPRAYGREFDRRARKRYLFNCFRRSVGLTSKPIPRHETGGLEKTLRGFLALFVSRHENADVEELLKLLERGVENPQLVSETLKGLVRAMPRNRLDRAEREELREVIKHVGSRLRLDARRKVSAILRSELRDITAKLARRPFIQLMSGSTTKAYAEGNPDRHFNLYEIGRDSAGYTVAATSYDWYEASHSFERGSTVKFPFAHGRGAPA